MLRNSERFVFGLNQPVYSFFELAFDLLHAIKLTTVDFFAVRAAEAVGTARLAGALTAKKSTVVSFIACSKFERKFEKRIHRLVQPENEIVRNSEHSL